MKDLAQAIANTVQAAQNNNDSELGTSIVDIVESGVGLLGKVIGL